VVVIHCAGGVDRTGIVSALILRSAGVGTDEVALDWAQSEVGWAPFVGEWISTAENEEEAAKRRRLATMPVEVMRDVLAELEDRHGGIDGYLGAAGVTDSNLRLLHARLRG
jgi:protein tyrosine/serine phosphatase